MENTKLELKHLVPYLPYGLKITADNDTWELTCISTVQYYTVWAENRWDDGKRVFLPDINAKNSELGRGFLLSSIKPILRPLSDLTKDEHFDLYMELCEEFDVTRCDHLLMALQNKSYYAFDIYKLEGLEEFMYKNHFDWRFGLIDQNLAIDINTIPR